MNLEFATAQRIIFGAGAFDQLGKLVAAHGRRVFLVAAGLALAPGGPADRLADQLRPSGVTLTSHAVGGEPEVEGVDAAVEAARVVGAEVVVGIGGGSALDTAKAIAGLLTNGGSALDYMEGVGQGRLITRPALPFLAVPTTAGPGAEVTRNAVILSRAHGVKASVRSPFLLPHVALIDPLLTHSLPPLATASTGLDAMTQLIEPYVSKRATPLTDAIVMGALARGAQALPRAWADGGDAPARADMAYASLSGGLALANAGLGAVHGFAAPLGGAFPVPHGIACALLLAPVMAANVAALRALPPDAPAGPSTATDTLRRYTDIGAALTGERGSAAIEAGIDWVTESVRQFNLPGLAHYGVTQADLPELIAAAQQASSMKANPIPLDNATLHRLLHQALS